MSIDKQLEAIRRQTARYSFQDGLAEQGLGVLFLVGALVVTMQTAMTTPYDTFMQVALSIFIMIVTVFGVQTVNRLKQRVTYPRTGYVQPRAEGQFPVVALVLALAIIGMAVAYKRITFPDGINQAALFEAITISASLVYVGATVRLARFYLLALVPLVISLGMGAVSADIAMIVTIGGTGLILLATGFITLQRYLHAHPQEA